MISALKYTYKHGRRLKIELNSGVEYEAKFYGSDQHRITLYDVLELPNRAPIPGLTHIFKKEFFSIEKLNGDDDASESETEENIERQPNFPDFEEWTKLTKNWLYITVLNEDFEKCLKHLNDCDTIAINGFGDKNRYHNLYLFAISTKQNMYIIDIIATGNKAFARGLKNILESRTILKVIFNGMVQIEHLYHKHNITLRNYFDIQIADKMVNSQSDDNMTTLSACLGKVLTIPNNVTEEINNLDITTLSKRPINKSFLQKVALSVAYLIPLRNILEGKMLKTLKAANDYNLNRTRSKSPITALLVTPEKVLSELDNMKHIKL